MVLIHLCHAALPPALSLSRATSTNGLLFRSATIAASGPLLVDLPKDLMSGQLVYPEKKPIRMQNYQPTYEPHIGQIAKAWVGKSPMGAFEEQAKANLAMFEQAMRLWAPFAAQTPPPPPPAQEADEADIGDLKRQMEAMQRQLDQLSGKRKP